MIDMFISKSRLAPILIAAGLAGACTTPSSTAQSADQAYLVRSFEVSEPVVDIRTSGGSIDVSGRSGRTVEVRMIVRQNGRVLTPADTDLDDFEITVAKQGDRIVAHARRKGALSWGSRTPSISFEVTMPRSGSVEANTSGGSVAARGIRGELDLDTSGGSVSIQDTEGNAQLDTSGGSISIEGHTGRADASTSGGGISLERSQGEFRVSTSGGSISIERVSGQVEAQTSGGSIRAELDRVDGDLDLSTSGGSVRITVPGGQGYDLDLAGTRVDVRLVDFTGTSQRNRVSGTMAGGGHAIRARTSGGTISLDFQ